MNRAEAAGTRLGVLGAKGKSLDWISVMGLSWRILIKEINHPIQTLKIPPAAVKITFGGWENSGGRNVPLESVVITYKSLLWLWLGSVPYRPRNLSQVRYLLSSTSVFSSVKGMEAFSLGSLWRLSELGYKNT